MCGIAGLMDLQGERLVNQQALNAMSNALIHRGPDGEGQHNQPGIGLAHRRLAIIDLEGSIQPFQASSNSNILTYNGEIYNYLDLAKDLKATGIALKTKGDTEILAEGMARFGPKYINRLQGMFAFAFWDEQSKTLLLARDRLGEKPLYYGVTEDGWLAFASEIDALMASGLFQKKLNDHAVADYFYYGYVPDPKTIYENIFKLEPGHILTAKRGQNLELKPYWSISFQEKNQYSYQNAEEELRELLDRSVHDQMIADVPLGAFLSGGVDSSAIVASMKEKSAAPVTCSIGFDEASHDERSYAREIATQFKTDHHEGVAKLHIASMIDKIAATYGEPFADSSALPTYIVSKLARQHVTVALSGDGGDEVFAGYRRYKFFMAEERLRKHLPHKVRRPIFGPLGRYYPKLDFAPRVLRFKTTFQALGEDQASAYARASGIMLPERARLLMSDDFHHQLQGYDSRDIVRQHMVQADSRDPLSQALYTDLKTWLAGRMLVKTDRASMANSLEVRPPLLDHRLVEWAATLPSSFKLSGQNGKRILKSSLEPRLSRDILYRTKQGFGLPLSQWLRANRDNPLDRLRDQSAWKQSGILNVDHIEKMIDDHKSNRSDFGQELWSVLMFDAFLAKH